MASNDEYQQRRTFECQYLHPAIEHISFNGVPSKEQIDMLNKMVESVYNMPTKELKDLITNKKNNNEKTG